MLAVTVLAAVAAFGLAGWQVTRAMNGEERISIVSWIEIACAIIVAFGIPTWTWLVVENARRLLSASTNTPPSPFEHAAAWATPLVVAAGTVISVAYLERRLNPINFEETSPVPLALACIFLVVTLLVSYQPLFMLSNVMRRLGGGVGDLSRWVWVPISMAAVGIGTLVGLRFGGAYEDDFEGLAPAWALGVVFIPPIVIVVMLAWSGGRNVEDAVRFAYDRRSGHHSVGARRHRLGMLTRALRADARPSISHDIHQRIRVVPGGRILGLALMISVAALTLISVVGALVMFLFWRDSSAGSLIPAERQRGWDALTGLQDLQRLVAAGAVAVAAVWSFVSVLNARLASGRRRNPVLAALSWPAAAYAIWWIAVRYGDTDEVTGLVMCFALQAVAAYVPFFLLERSAISVGARRGPLRLAHSLAVVLLIHIQGLGGLATLVVETDIDRFGRIAGYLSLAALLQLIATVVITEASSLIGDASASMADKHNFLADQRTLIEQRIVATAPGPSISGADQPVESLVAEPAAAPVPVADPAAAPSPAAEPAPVDTPVEASAVGIAPVSPVPAPPMSAPVAADGGLFAAPSAPPAGAMTEPPTMAPPVPAPDTVETEPGAPETVETEPAAPEPAAPGPAAPGHIESEEAASPAPSGERFTIPRLVRRPVISPPITIAASQPPEPPTQ